MLPRDSSKPEALLKTPRREAPTFAGAGNHVPGEEGSAMSSASFHSYSRVLASLASGVVLASATAASAAGPFPLFVQAPPPGAPQQPAFEYAAKIVCGAQEDPKDMRLARGFYATTINVHNPNAELAKFFKKLALTIPPGDQQPGKIIPIATDRLEYDQALAVDCDDVVRRAFGGAMPGPFFEGFIVIQSQLKIGRAHV